ncbi:MAG: PAS domain S-box protein [Ignavibacteriales bacterium]|nr:PAS domain S-box protein [Ignavibacteriales bacterium]
MKLKFKLRPAVVVSITAIIGIVMIASAYIELQESKKEIFQLLFEHSSSLLETIVQSSKNALNSGSEIETLLTEKLLDNARLIKQLDNLNLLTNEKLRELASTNNLFRINIFNKSGTRVMTSRVPEPDHPHGEFNVNRFDELEPILSGRQSELIIGIKNAEYTDEQRFAVAVKRTGGGAIVINLDAKEFLEFRKKIGIGKIVRDISDNHGIEFIVLQDSLGILAASADVDSISSVEEDMFIAHSLNSDSVRTRVIEYNKKNIYEVSKRLVIDGETIGIFRLGISMEDIERVEQRMMRRLVIISLILMAISVIVLSIIFTSQTLKAVSTEFDKFKTTASSVLENMGDAVVVIDSNDKITLFNKSAEKLFDKFSSKVIGTEISNLFGENYSLIKNNIISSSDSPIYFEQILTISSESKYLSFSITKNKSTRGSPDNFTLVIKDLTTIRKLEEQAKRNEKLSAMGELASGVAHEIRNPINAIGMIAQRLNKEFSPVSDAAEYHKINQLLKSEVDRINKIITQFLNYARPVEIRKSKIDAKNFIGDLFSLFQNQAKVKNINFISGTTDSFIFNIDAELMKQALINILQNAFEATEQNGTVKVESYKESTNAIITISDTGIGISEKNLKKIFDLYFTTKKDGNGLGLSITQKIISQHSGSIELSSKENIGTTFKIILPLL